MIPEGDIEKHKRFYLAFLEDFEKKKPQALENQEIYFKTSIDRLKHLIDFYPLQTVVALHAKKALLYFLIAANKFYFQFLQSQSPLAKIIENMAKKIRANAYDDEGLLKKQKEYSDVFESKLFKGIEGENLKNYYEKDIKTETLRKLISSIYSIVGEKQYFTKRTFLNKFIQEEVLVQEPKTFLEEVSLNWIKENVQQLQEEKDFFLCCRIHFERCTTSELSGFNESSNQEFKDYRWPLENESIKFHLIKTFVGFLNTTGGIIFVGLKQDKSKIVEVKGIELSQQHKIDFLYFLHNDILSGVYPRDAERREDQEEKEKEGEENSKSTYKMKLKKELQRQKSTSQGYEFRISKYVSVDFLDVFDRKTYLNSHGEKHRLYIARIKIKKGNPRELYHIINKQNIPQTFLREDKSVKRKDIKQFYDLFYRRISGSQTTNLQNQNKDWHEYCRFNPKSVIQEDMKFKEEKKN